MVECSWLHRLAWFSRLDWIREPQRIDILMSRFHPKEDVSSSTSLKSSVQRGIRSSLLTQMPFLTQPAYKEPSSTSTSAPAAEGGVSAEDPAAQADDQGDDSEDEGAGAGAGKKGKGKGGKGKGGGKGGKKGKGKDKEDKKGKGDKEEEEEGDGEMLVIDEIWPKKEALGLTKWYVPSTMAKRDIQFCLGQLHNRGVAERCWEISRPGIPAPPAATDTSATTAYPSTR